jgi:CBS domain-containing protein
VEPTQDSARSKTGTTEAGGRLRQTTVRAVMTGEVYTVTPDVKVDVALEAMRANQIRRLPVVSSTGRVIGIITRAEAEAAMPGEVTFLGAEGEAAEVPTVRDVMTDSVFSVGPDDSVARAAQLLMANKIGALPVLDGHELVGILTESDIFRFVVSELGDGA